MTTRFGDAHVGSRRTEAASYQADTSSGVARRSSARRADARAGPDGRGRPARRASAAC
jgi:hypothetical protein